MDVYDLHLRVKILKYYLMNLLEKEYYSQVLERQCDQIELLRKQYEDHSVHMVRKIYCCLIGSSSKYISSENSTMN